MGGLGRRRRIFQNDFQDLLIFSRFTSVGLLFLDFSDILTHFSRSTWFIGNTPTCAWMDLPRFPSAETWWPTSRAGERVWEWAVFTKPQRFPALAFPDVNHPPSFPLSRTDIFVFLLSTRAGGLGINLTAADTVSGGRRSSSSTWPSARRRRCVSVAGHLLRQRLEPHGGPAGHGPGPPAGPDQTGHRLPPHLPGHHRGEDPAEGQGEERGLTQQHASAHAALKQRRAQPQP